MIRVDSWVVLVIVSTVLPMFSVSRVVLATADHLRIMVLIASIFCMYVCLAHIGAKHRAAEGWGSEPLCFGEAEAI
jgi:hypothetical protein